MKSVSNAFDYLKGEKFISLTTFYKSGKGVATPVEYIRKGEKLYVATSEDSYKVKRLRNNSSALLAPCTMRGKLKGENIDVEARILPEEEEQVAIEAINELYDNIFYKLVFMLSKLAFWRKKEKRVYLEITA
ncbi:MAG: PPOX class F420-dependent oxidoreductase [Candidatus Hodarchaeales archaeon]|jgi:PPOX class probable F420-dependent enzyme